MHLFVEIADIKGHCPVFETGDHFIIQDGYKLVAKKPLCMHALGAILPFYNALRFVEPGRLGLADTQDPSRACVQCPDAVDCTGGGTVVFHISRIDNPK